MRPSTSALDLLQVLARQIEHSPFVPVATAVADGHGGFFLFD